MPPTASAVCFTERAASFQGGSRARFHPPAPRLAALPAQVHEIFPGQADTSAALLIRCALAGCRRIVDRVLHVVPTAQLRLPEFSPQGAVISSAAHVAALDQAQRVNRLPANISERLQSEAILPAI